MINNFINTIEIALIIILPLILYFQRVHKGYIIYVYAAVLYLIWFATYSLFHELCHVFGSWITSAKINDYQLIPRFWEGDFKNGYVMSDLHNGIQLFFSPISPYLRDMILLFIGYVILKRVIITHSFITGLIIILFVLSPIYDVFNNYFAFVLGAKNDFYCIRGTIGSIWTHLIGSLFTLTGLIVVLKVYAMLNKHPNIKLKNDSYNI